MLKYIELKTGFSDNGPAWIANVQSSRSGRTIYFNGRALSRANAVLGNHVDLDTGEEFWVSGVKRDGQDRHWAGSGKILIDVNAIDEYLSTVGETALDRTRFEVVEIKATDISVHHERENKHIT